MLHRKDNVSHRHHRILRLHVASPRMYLQIASQECCLSHESAVVTAESPLNTLNNVFHR